MDKKDETSKVKPFDSSVRPLHVDLYEPNCIKSKEDSRGMPPWTLGADVYLVQGKPGDELERARDGRAVRVPPKSERGGKIRWGRDGPHSLKYRVVDPFGFVAAEYEAEEDETVYIVRPENKAGATSRAVVVPSPEVRTCENCGLTEEARVQAYNDAKADKKLAAWCVRQTATYEGPPLPDCCEAWEPPPEESEEQLSDKERLELLVGAENASREAAAARLNHPTVWCKEYRPGTPGRGGCIGEERGLCKHCVEKCAEEDE